MLWCQLSMSVYMTSEVTMAMVRQRLQNPNTSTNTSLCDHRSWPTAGHTCPFSSPIVGIYGCLNKCLTLSPQRHWVPYGHQHTQIHTHVATSPGIEFLSLITCVGILIIQRLHFSDWSSNLHFLTRKPTDHTIRKNCQFKRLGQGESYRTH